MRPPISAVAPLVTRWRRHSGVGGRLDLLRPAVVLLSLFFCILCLALSVYGQGVGASGSIHGTVLDPTGAVVANATVTIHNAVSGYSKAATTDSQGRFLFQNVPFNPYHLTITAAGFAPFVRDVEVRSAVSVEVKASLELAGASTSVTVESAPDLIENTPTAHTDVSRQLFNKVPLESQSSSVSSLVTLTTPGVTADSNGLFHGMGDHAQNSFSVDGQPITDQQSKVFSNQIPMDSISSMEVIQGAPPAEYGDKTSLVIVVNTRSALGEKKPHGDVTASYGTFGTTNAGFTLGYGGKNWGNFMSANGMNTSRFLDPPELNAMHDKGNQQNLFDRVDYRFTEADTVHMNLGYTRSWFQTPNSFDAQTAAGWSGLTVNNRGLGPDGLPVGPQDQRSLINTFNIAPAWTRLLNTTTLFSLGGFIRQDRYHYYPSANPFADLTPGLQSQTIGQNRRLTNAGGRADLSYVKGAHNLKAGINFMHTFLRENDRFGIVDPTLNPVCLNADGSAYTNSALTDPANCLGPLQPTPGFVPLLGCYDLTRTAALPASDGCPGPASGLYDFAGRTDVKELALYLQDAITAGNWNFNLGIRGDLYNGITTARLAEPRLGAAYNIKKTNTILRFSYARTLETPFNENLVLASDGCNYPGVNALMAVAQGYPCLTEPLHPGTRNEYHAGLEQALGRYLVVSGEYIWKYTDGAYDFSVLGNTPITFPIVWDKSKIPGYAVRVSVPNFHGLTALLVLSSVSARFFQPQISGIGVTPAGQGGSGVFRIDHDEKFNQTTHLQYQPWKNGPWFGLNWRYDSGLAAGAVPFAVDATTPVDLTELTADQQLQAGLFCGSQFPTLATPLTACAPSQFGSALVTIPAPGTEDDDHNPPRISPRHLVDLSVGNDNLFHGDKYKWSARLTVVNLTNKVALYNFLSTFSGTHYVTPRTITAEIGFHF
jgi:hypothetical protein